MKILLVNYRYFVSGGPERYMFNVKNELENLGHEVIPFSTKNIQNEYSKYSEYFTSNVGGESVAYFDEYKKTPKIILETLVRQFYSKKVENDLIRLIKSEKPDICYLIHHINKLSPSVLIACKKMNLPVVHRLSDYYLLCPKVTMYDEKKFCNECKQSLFFSVKKKCIKSSFLASYIKYLAYSFHKNFKIYNNVDHFICTNEFMYEQMLDYGYPSKKLSVNYTFFNKENFGGKILNRNHKKLTFLYVGRFDVDKGYTDLMSAIELLNNKKNLNENVEFKFVGAKNDKEIEDAQCLVNDKKISKYVTIYSKKNADELAGFYNKGDAVIIPSKWVENLPNVLLESLYFEIPVVVPNFGSFINVVDDTVSYKYEPHNINSLSDVIKKIIQSPDLLKNKSENCVTFLEENFSKEVHMEKLMSLFNSLVKH